MWQYDFFEIPLFRLPIIQAVLDLIHSGGLFGPEHVRLLQHDVHLGSVQTLLVDFPLRLERKLDRI